jgi:hypothetical protein
MSCGVFRVMDSDGFPSSQMPVQSHLCRGGGPGNDTHTHGPLAGRHISKEMQWLVAKAEANPKSIASLSLKESMELYLTTWVEQDLHRKAARFGVENMLTGEFFGAQDKLADPRLHVLWKNWNMDAMRANAIADVDAEFYAGRLPWACETQDKLLKTFLRRGRLDGYKACQDDEGEDAGVDCPYDDDDMCDDFPYDLPEEMPVDDTPAIVGEEGLTSKTELEACSALAEQMPVDEVGRACHDDRMEQLEVLDRLVDDSGGLKNRRVAGAIGRARAIVLKGINRHEEADGTHEAIGARILSEDRARRKARDIEMEANQAKMAAIADVTKKLEAVQADVAERQRAFAAATRTAAREKAIDDASVMLEWTSLDSHAVGVATARKNRGAAFHRIISLCASDNIEYAEHLRNFDFVFAKWDRMMAAKNDQPSQHGNMMYKLVQVQLSRLQKGQSDVVISWWIHETRMVKSGLVLPSLAASSSSGGP